jgi:hypothetical protein
VIKKEKRERIKNVKIQQAGKTRPQNWTPKLCAGVFLHNLKLDFRAKADLIEFHTGRVWSGKGRAFVSKSTN